LHLLEVIACSFEDALAAEVGGADRLEICSRLDLAGLTPARGLVASIVGSVRIPVRVMIRVNDTFLVGEQELMEMQRQVAEFAALPMEGVICGYLDSSGRLDFAVLDRILDHAPSHWKLTIHRVFDAAVGDAEEKFAAIRRHGRADRILSGGPRTDLLRLSTKSDEHLRVIAGGGVTLENLPQWVQESGCREFHVGRAARTPEDTTAPVDAARVRQLRDLLSQCEGKGGPGSPPSKPA